MRASTWGPCTWLAATMIAIGCGDDGDSEGDGSTGAAEDADGADAAGGADGDDSGGSVAGADACAVRIEVSGAVMWSTPETPTCASSLSPTEDIDVLYYFLSGDVDVLSLHVEGITEGETGTFDASVELWHADGRKFVATQCSVTVDAHVAKPENDDEFSRAYLAHGTGSCTAEATDDGTGDTIIIAPFEANLPARWST